MIFRTNLSTLTLHWSDYVARWQEAEVKRKDDNIVLIRQDKKFFTFEFFKVIQDANPIDRSLQDNVLIPNNFFEYICHIGCAVNLHSITNSGLIPGGQNSSKDRQTVFFTAVNPMLKNHQDPIELDLTKPRLASYKQKWKVHHRVGRTCARRPYLQSHSRGKEKIQRTMVSYSKQSRQKSANETSI